MVHTPSMNLKNAAFLALIGTLLFTVLQAFHLVLNVLNVIRGLMAAATLFSSLVSTFAWITLAVFFFVFHKSQS
jgi:hypothetical protein